MRGRRETSGLDEGLKRGREGLPEGPNKVHRDWTKDLYREMRGLLDPTSSSTLGTFGGCEVLLSRIIDVTESIHESFRVCDRNREECPKIVNYVIRIHHP